MMQLRILRWEDDPGLFRWAQGFIKRVLIKQQQESQIREAWNPRSGSHSDVITCFEDGGSAKML